MRDNSYFQKALADFTHEAASGGAIRHLTDAGYTVVQIVKELDFPTPYEKVRREVWERLLRTGVILTEEPGAARQEETVSYIREYDKYGKAAFRRVTKTEQKEKVIYRRRQEISKAEFTSEGLCVLLRDKTEQNGEDSSYMACDFGRIAAEDIGAYQKMLAVLDGADREYVEGLPWEIRIVYHRLIPRMLGILMKLYGAGLYCGSCYFLKTEEIIEIKG